MSSKKLVVKENPDIKAFIENFNVDQVILDNYYYSSLENIFDKNFAYTEKDISIILQLTDTEYADLVTKYFRLITNPTIAEVPVDNTDIQNKIVELEEKLKNSREFEEAEKNISGLESNLSEINNKLKVSHEFESKYLEAKNEFSKLRYLEKYDLNRIHADLVENINEIKKVEDEIHKFKGTQIQRISKTSGYDSNKIQIAIIWSIGIILIGLLLLFINISFIIVLFSWVIGFVLTVLIVYMAKIEVDHPFVQDKDTPTVEGFEKALAELKSKRAKILEFVNISKIDDFFELKARYMSCKHNLEYLKEENKKYLESHNSLELITKYNEVVSQLSSARSKLLESTSLLKPEEYLSIKREVDNLKIKLNQKNNNSVLSIDQIKNKLHLIRNELSEKIPQYTEIIKSRFNSSFTNIKAFIDNILLKIGAGGTVEITENGVGFNELSNFEKTLVQYSLVREIYKNNFVFIINFLSSWSAEDKDKLDLVQQQIIESETEFYIVENG